MILVSSLTIGRIEFSVADSAKAIATKVQVPGIQPTYLKLRLATTLLCFCTVVTPVSSMFHICVASSFRRIKTVCRLAKTFLKFSLLMILETLLLESFSTNCSAVSCRTWSNLDQKFYFHLRIFGTYYVNPWPWYSNANVPSSLTESPKYMSL